MSLIDYTNRYAYNRNYSYTNGKHTLTSITGGSNTQTFSWDANGNMTEHLNHPELRDRRLLWDEDNRLAAFMSDDNFAIYCYDDGGERTLKIAGFTDWGGDNGMEYYYFRLNNPTLYTSPYLVATQKGYTKHYYIEGQRIASKIGKGGLSCIDSAHYFAEF